MKKMLVIKGYISKPENSYSQKVLDEFLKMYKEKNSDDEIIELDLNTVDMAQKTLNQANFGDFFNEEDSDKYINQLKSVDKVVMVTPMINFTMSPLIKNYFDHILVANKTFTYKYAEKGQSKGLLDNLKVEIIIAQGSPLDYYNSFAKLEELLTGIWKFAGAEVVGTLMMDGTKTTKFAKENLFDKKMIGIKKQIQKDLETF